MRVLLVPLDNRPCNLLFPQRLAGIAGVELLLPPVELLGHFLEPGRPDELLSWLRSQAMDADALVLSVDMLLYGGLVASRSPAVPLPMALARLETVRDLCRAWAVCPVFCSSIITRLTITGSNARALEWTGPIFRYSELLDDPGEADRAELESLERAIPGDLLRGYLEARSRNHQVNRALIDAAGASELDYLVLAQEDCGPRGIHRLEQGVVLEDIRKAGVADRVSIYPGADEVSMTLVTRAVLADRATRPGVAVHFFPGSAHNMVPVYEDRPLSDSVLAQIRAVGAQLVDPIDSCEPEALLHLAVVGKGEDAGDAGLEGVEQWIRARLDEGCMVAVADVAAPNGADLALMERLRSGLAGELAAFAGWNTAGNSIGSALSHGLCLGLCVGAASGPGDLRPCSHYRFLFERLLDDAGYQSVVRPALSQELRQRGLLPANLAEQSAGVERLVAVRLEPLARELFKDCFQGIRCREGILSGLQELRITLPWPRTFEVLIDAEFECTP